MNKHETEQEFLDKQRSLYTGQINEILTQVLNDKFPNVTNAFLLFITTEQAEDIYHILLNSSTIVFVEISRINPDINTVLIDKMSVNEYKKGLSSWYRRNLDIAIKLQNKK